MSDLGKYTFLPWIRQGISTQINQTDGTKITGNANVTVSVSIGGGSESATPAQVTINLLGPGNVTGFDTRAITRHWPRRDIFEVEPNFMPLLEMFPADLPWRYTPATADAHGRLRPWLALIVLRDDEIDTLEGPSSSNSNSKLTTKSNVALPRADQLWAWAHVHVDGMDSIDTPTLQSLLDQSSHQAVARLLCARRLDAKTAYNAFLVPTLEATRLSALGLPVDPNLDVSQAAWKNDGSVVELPVFYSWRFQTSEFGDFETLARRIVPQVLPPTMGLRPTDVSQPGMGLPEAASQPLAVESALRALDTKSTAWDAGEKSAWQAPLGALLDLPAVRLEQPGALRTLAPPLYGRWYAAADQLDLAAPEAWFEDANIDPRNRVASALGWQVVQDQQQQLLAGAWEQVGAVRAANTELRFAQLAREAAARMFDRHVMTLPVPSLALFTQPLHARVLIPTADGSRPVTMSAMVKASPLRAGLFHPAFRRLLRPLGPLGLRLGQALVKTPPAIFDRVNSGALILAPAPPTPAQISTPASSGKSLAPPWLTPHLADWLSKVPHPLWRVIEVLLEALLALWPQFVDPPLRDELVQFLTEVQQALASGTTPAEDIQRRVAVRDGTLAPQQILSAPARTGFVAQPLAADGTLPPLQHSTAPEDTRFRDAVAAAFGDLQAPPAPGDVLRPLDLPMTLQAVTKAIDPRLTIAASLKNRLALGYAFAAADVLDPVMAAPSFPQPMYKPLYDISADWLLAGFGALPPDVSSLAHPNERFIESYMLGVNDEMGRTLLFNEYPTDQRGSYFRQFWDVNGVPNPEPDITPLAGWSKSSTLGSHSTRPGVDSYLVLIVRAELLRHYPNMVVYAVKAEWNQNGTRSVPKQNPVELQPEFRGSLGVGAGFWGFKLAVDDARGAASSHAGPAGWYFALQEHTSEPRFGLEPADDGYGGTPTSWQTMKWSDLAANANSLQQIDYIDLGAPLPHLGSIVDPKHAHWHVADGALASDLAYISYRESVRLLVHASRMIPSDV